MVVLENSKLNFMRLIEANRFLQSIKAGFINYFEFLHILNYCQLVEYDFGDSNYDEACFLHPLPYLHAQYY
jgi:hypothetical protein